MEEITETSGLDQKKGQERYKRSRPSIGPAQKNPERLLIQEKRPDCASVGPNLWLSLSVFMGIAQAYFERF